MCPVEWHLHEHGVCNGQVVQCDRQAGHMPGDWHRSRPVGIVWYVDRRHGLGVSAELPAAPRTAEEAA